MQMICVSVVLVHGGVRAVQARRTAESVRSWVAVGVRRIETRAVGQTSDSTVRPDHHRRAEIRRPGLPAGLLCLRVVRGDERQNEVMSGGKQPVVSQSSRRWVNLPTATSSTNVFLPLLDQVSGTVWHTLNLLTNLHDITDTSRFNCSLKLQHFFKFSNTRPLYYPPIIEQFYYAVEYIY